MRISEAVYTLASIQRTSSAGRFGNVASRSQSIDISASKGSEPSPRTKNTASSDLDSTSHTLADMLHQHFVEEIRLRDRDGDGLLSLSEYASTPEEFDALDADADGRIGAFDLVRGALQRNHDLSEIVAGPWAPIYSAIMNSKSTDGSSLEQAARTGALETINQILTAEPPVAVSNESGGMQSVPTIEDLMDEFLTRHDKLDLLRSRLDDLALRLGRSPQYRHIDQTA